MAPGRTKLAVFGGSSISGFGVRERSYGAVTARRYGLEFVNRAGFGATLRDSLTVLDVADECEIVIAMHGTNEAMVRPTDRSLRFVPARWRRRGWMDPRAYFPTDWKRALPKRVESGLRWRVKVALIRMTGGTHLVDIDEFRELHLEFIRELKRRGVPRIVLVGVAIVDERYFPRSPELMARYDAIVREQARAEKVIYIDARKLLRRWDDYYLDHLHAAESGHERIVAQIFEELARDQTEVLGPRNHKASDSLTERSVAETPGSP